MISDFRIILYENIHCTPLERKQSIATNCRSGARDASFVMKAWPQSPTLDTILYPDCARTEKVKLVSDINFYSNLELVMIVKFYCLYLHFSHAGWLKEPHHSRIDYISFHYFERDREGGPIMCDNSAL